MKVHLLFSTTQGFIPENDPSCWILASDWDDAKEQARSLANLDCDLCEMKEDKTFPPHSEAPRTELIAV